MSDSRLFLPLGCCSGPFQADGTTHPNPPVSEDWHPQAWRHYPLDLRELPPWYHGRVYLENIIEKLYKLRGCG